ncbi:MAG: autotransporter domain-containing protein [Pseudomonadota bacterium]
MSIRTPDFTTTFTSATAIATALIVAPSAYAQETVSDIRSETVEVGEGETLEVTAEGSIEPSGPQENGVDAEDSTTIINAGSIAALGEQSSAVVVGENAVVTNSGRIVAADLAAADPFAGASVLRTDEAGVFADDGLTLTNEAGATLIAEASSGFTDGAVVRAGDEATIVNAGTIQTGSNGVEAISVGNDLDLNNSGSILSARERAIEAGDDAAITNSGTIEASDRAINLGDGATITNEMGGLINTTGDSDTIQTGDNLTIINNGTISNEGFDTKIIDAGDGLTVTNNGTITSDWKGVEGEENFTLTNNAGARIFSTNDEAVEADGPGLVVVNDGEIISPKDDAVDGGDNVTITNTGLIQGGENDGLELNSGTITNSGTIESLSSDPDGDFILDGEGVETMDREIDAAIDFDGGTDGNEDGMVTNEAGGLIVGDIGINTSSGATGSDANEGSQTIVNFGTITGRGTNPETGREDAVLLGAGNDVFQQWQTGITNGTVDGGTGLGTFGEMGEGGELEEGAALEDAAQDFEIPTENDQLIFGNNSMEAVDRLLADVFNPELYTGFEFIGFLDVNGGGINLVGDTDQTLNILGGTATIQGNVTETVQVLGTADLTIAADASVNVDGADGINVEADDTAITNLGSITSVGERAIEAGDADGVTITNSGTIEATDRAINLGDSATITNEMGGLINTTGDSDTIQTGDDLTIINNGTISNEGFDTKIIDAGDGLTVTNNGTITSDWKGVEGEANFTLTNNAGARIFSTNDEAVEADDAGLVVVNDGEIIAPKDDAVDGGADVTITNTGLIQGGENDGLELDSGTITNSGIIESLSSDPSGDFSDAGLTNRELDAGIDFDGVDDPDTLAGPATDLVTNLAGGVIRGDIGINASSGNFVDDGEGGSQAGSPANVRSQTIVNFGEITANLINPVTGRMDAVLLSFGDDEFQQWTGAVVNGWVDLEGGDDTFILEGTSSSVSGSVSGGMGDDTAILAGDLDSDNIVNFETIQLGSTLGGTLNDLDITGNRAIAGDVVHVGVVNIDLGVDSLTTSGSITLEESGVLNIGTPLDVALIGQSVLVFDVGTGFTNKGASVNILDDDLLIDYTPVAGSLRVNVSSADVLVGDTDPNLAAASFALARGLTQQTLEAPAFATLNALPDASAYADALAQALPSLSNGAAREIFETGNLAGQALDRHLSSEGSGVWGQIAVRGVERDAVSATVDGYESDQLVFTVGGDVALGETLRFGVLASYADIDIDDETATGARRSQQEIESIRLGAYAAGTFGDRAFVNAEIAYLTGEIESSRAGPLGAVSSAYDFDGFAGRFVVGYDLLPDENVALTPTMGLNAAQINFDDAVEAGGLGFTVDRDDANFFEGRLGIEASALLSEMVNGFIQGTVVYDFLDDPRLLNLTSAQVGSFAIAPALREQNRFELAAGATVDVSENFAIDLGYLGDFASGYDGHSGRVSVRIAF